MNNNVSLSNEDSRSVQRIIFEKANFGTVPTFFRVEGDDRLHPVQWTKHPHLAEIVFSDGSSSRVVASYDPDLEAQVMSQLKGSGDKDVDPNGDDIPWPAVPTPPYTEDALNDLRDMVDDGMKVAYAESINQTPRVTRPITDDEAIMLGLSSGPKPTSPRPQESFKPSDFAPILEQNLEERN
jgi:hypothetical protein